MSLTQRGDVFVADLREYEGGTRQSLFTKDKDLARWLHNELEQMALAGKPFDGGTVRALTTQRRNAAAPLAGVAAPQLSVPASTAPAQETGRKTITLREAYKLAMLNRDRWRDSGVQFAIEGPYNVLAEYFGAARMLHTITAKDIHEFQQKLLKDGLTGSTINRRTSVLSVIFRETERLYIITSEPEYDVKMPTFWPVRYKVEDPKVLSLDEERAVLQWFAGQPRETMQNMVDLCTVLVDTGFRVSEALRIESPRSVDFVNKRVWARKTKTGHDRSVPMTTRVFEILDRRCREQGMTHPFAAIRCPQQFWDQMRKAIGKKDEPHFTIHALRHTCATRLAAAGVPLFKMMLWLGHTQVSTTQRYVTLASAALDGVSDALEFARECAKVAATEESEV